MATRRRLPRARHGVVGEQQLGEHGPGDADALGIRLDGHALVGRADARRLHDPRAFHVDAAHAAHAHRRHVLRVAQHRDIDPESACGIEHGRPGRHGHGLAVDAQRHRVGAHDRDGIGQTPSGHR